MIYACGGFHKAICKKSKMVKGQKNLSYAISLIFPLKLLQLKFTYLITNHVDTVNAYKTKKSRKTHSTLIKQQNSNVP